MSVPSSPRIPMSPDLSRRRIPRPKDKRRALRDFYGIQQNQNNGPVEYDPLLDEPNFDVKQYLVKLNENSDMKNLLGLENQMIRDIRVLDGERKALVYDNYGRMISATDTIKHITTDMEPLDRATFDPILKSISDMTKDINDHAESEDRDGDSEESPEEMMVIWLKEGSSRLMELIKNKEYQVAADELEDIENDLAPATMAENEKTQLFTELKKLGTMVRDAQKGIEERLTQDNALLTEPTTVST